jgi:phage-related minor tail protein
MSGKANGGEVEYLLVADYSNLDSDLNKANQKVKKAAKESADDSVKIEEQKTKDIKKESDKVVKGAEKAADDVVNEWKDAGRDAAKAISKIGEEDVEFGVDSDTSKAESKIKAVIKDKSVKIKGDADMSDVEEEIKNLNDVAKETGEEIGDTFSGNVGKVLKDSFSDATGSAIPFVDKIGELTSGLSGAQVAAVGAGAAAVGMGALAVGAADDMKGAMNAFLSETGKSREETERYQKVLEDIYANNYGENFQDIASAMGDVTKQLGDMDDASLQNVTESAFALRDTFGYEIPESTRAAKAMMDNFGVSGEEAMSMIAAGAQNGLDYSGELLDSISEYSVQFDKMGLSADDMFNIFQKGAESGAFNLDKVGDAVKEMSIRVVDGSETTKQGFELLGLNADEMAAKFAAGGDTAKEAFNQTLDALAALEDPIAQNTAGVDLMGTMWEDLGPEAVSALADIEDGAYDASDAMEQIKDVKYDDLGSQFEELKRNVELLLVPIGEALIPLLSTLAESILPLVTDVLGPLISQFVQLLSPIVNLISAAIQPLISAFIELVQTAIQPLTPVIQALMGVFTSVMNSISGTVTGVINNITNIFRNLIDFIKNVFTGNWRDAWNNVKEIFSNAVSGLASIFKAPINAIVDGWNSLANSIGSVSVPEWVPIAGGKSFSLPKMSRLKVGLDYVPHDMFPAFLDEGEWVLTKEEANMLRSLGGIEGILSIMGKTGVDTQKNIIVQGGNTEIDYDRLGMAVAASLVNAGVGFKCDEVVFARLIKDLIDYV